MKQHVKNLINFRIALKNKNIFNIEMRKIIQRLHFY